MFYTHKMFYSIWYSIYTWDYFYGSDVSAYYSLSVEKKIIKINASADGFPLELWTTPGF